MSIRRTAVIAALLLVSAAAVAGMVSYTRHVETAMKNATVADGGTITLLKDRKTVEPVTARALDGTPVSLASLRGKVVIVNFWATWCPPCREEIPDLIALQAKYKDQLQIVGVSQDEAPPSMVAQFATEHGMNYPIVMDSPEFEHTFTNIHALPTSFIIDRDGRIAQRHVGMLNASLTEVETRVLAGLDTNVRVEYREDQDKVKLENAAQANKIPGVDLSKLTPAQRTKVLQTLNTEECGCGCGQTLAQCRIEDPSCTVSLPAAEELVKRIVAETPR
ncbi:MAG TPA: TlpA disulfide reductase family protein [Vicinamibacterales bacterium]|jgi:thiol-disulfide isomerase/thioredoxin|nr:TlpA disulfide reductase family protein [Vicinamibacterales bacterium]